MKLQMTLTITSHSALSVGAGGSSGTIADKSIVRDGWGRPLIPGSQVKGKLRWAAEQLLRGLGHAIPAPADGSEREETPNLVRSLFGSPQHRSPLHFADLPGIIGELEQLDALRSSPEQRRTQIRPSVAIDRRRGTAADRLLIFQEAAPELMRFHAERAVTGTIATLEEAALLWAAARLTTRWGGAKSRGLGWASLEARVWLHEDQGAEEEETKPQQEQDEESLRQALRGLALGRGGV